MAVVRYLEKLGVRHMLTQALSDGRTLPKQIPVLDVAQAFSAAVLTGGQCFADDERNGCARTKWCERSWVRCWIWIPPRSSVTGISRVLSRATIRANTVVAPTIRCWRCWPKRSWCCMPGCAAAIPPALAPTRRRACHLNCGAARRRSQKPKPQAVETAPTLPQAGCIFLGQLKFLGLAKRPRMQLRDQAGVFGIIQRHVHHHRAGRSQGFAQRRGDLIGMLDANHVVVTVGSIPGERNGI